ncbi:FAD linked oxidase domain-containing protein [Saccharothrix espanaensis DSM 44229]|uniref:FAD linked oxidase domain-containing protein n=1 Tax=Saccharothrix espanaensis (strain ATCC 51144 / DSM 44229 / JCM 9112 / NBRC 15066 / NRRL 15764) TaxID=1179773 RepID=K0K1H7_SACES|nr:FAD linked oxidase domain-containing protein [Saccharothrix espanaensis DSM 44229]
MTPRDERYALSRTQFIGRPVEVLPRAVARCGSAGEVVEALAFARSRGLPFAIRGGGHSNACHSSTSGLLVDVTPADRITVADGLVTVGGGVRIGRLARALAPLGRLVPTGSCPSVGVVGAALGGGFGSHGRLHGLTCDALVGAEVVLADGRVVGTAGEPDLLWALRGAGGGLGVVTSATFRTVAALPRTHFRLEWGFEHAAALVAWWQRWAPGAPDGVSAELVLLGPQYPEEPPVALLIGAAPDRAAVQAFADDFGRPAVAEIADLSAADAALLHATPYSAVAHDPSEIPLVHDRPGLSTATTGFFARPLPDDAVAALLAHFTADRVMGELREVAFTPWGGGYARTPGDATAFGHRDPAFLVKHTVLVGPGGAARRGEVVLARARAGRDLLRPWGTGGAYVNFPEPGLPDHAYHGANAARVRAVKAHYDPGGAFRPG